MKMKAEMLQKCVTNRGPLSAVKCGCELLLT